MAYSVHQDRYGADWPLGFVKVTTKGTPVSLMLNVDPAGVDDPSTPTSEITKLSQRPSPTCSEILLQGYKPAALDNGMIVNTGNIYVLRRAVGGNGNRTDNGAMVGIIPPGGSFRIPGSGGLPTTSLSPYRYFLDSDVDGEGAIVTLVGVN